MNSLTETIDTYIKNYGEPFIIDLDLYENEVEIVKLLISYGFNVSYFYNNFWKITK